MCDRDNASDYGLSALQYHAGVARLWDAMPEHTGPTEEDVFTLAAEAIRDARTARDANAGSMILMHKLLRLEIPDRKHGCLCDGCLGTLIELHGRKGHA